MCSIYFPLFVVSLATKFSMFPSQASLTNKQLILNNKQLNLHDKVITTLMFFFLISRLNEECIVILIHGLHLG